MDTTNNIDANNKSIRKRLRELNKISLIVSHSLSKNSYPLLSPRLTDAMGKSSLLLLCLLFFIFCVSSLLQAKGNRDYIFIAELSILIISVLFFYKRSEKANSWLGELDRLLLNYSPIDTQAYSRLQQMVSSDDTFNTETILEWCREEQLSVIATHAVKPKQKVNKKREKYQFRFVKRTIL